MEQATRNGNEHFKAENWWLELEYNLPFWNLEFHPFSCELLVFWGEGSHCIYPTSFHIQALTAHFFPVHPQAEQLLHLKKIQCPKKLCLFWLKHHYCSSKVVKKKRKQPCEHDDQWPRVLLDNTHQASRKATIQQCQQSLSRLEILFHLNFHGIVGGCIAPLTQSCFCQIIRNH